jgi:F-type H+-transporting ATPase subunit a
MHLSPDQVIFWQYGVFKLNATIAVHVGADARTGRRFQTHHAQTVHRAGTLPLAEPSGNRRHRHRETNRRGRPESAAEVYRLSGNALRICRAASICTVIPGYDPPTASLSTTAALALCVFVAVPFFGIEEQGVRNYLKSYAKPTPVMLPFNVISELSRTLALAVRLFGNMMSGAMIVGILLTITPFIFPIVMTVLGLLTGMVQAYIFSILAAVYIAAATRVRKPKPQPAQALRMSYYNKRRHYG